MGVQKISMVERVPTFKQPNAIFSVPFFIEEVDLDRIQLESDEYNESFLSGIKTTMGKDRFIDESYEYINEVIYINEVLVILHFA